MRRAIKCNYAGIHLISISNRLDWSILPKVAKYELLRIVGISPSDNVLRSS